MRINNIFFYLLMVLLIGFSACEEDDPTPVEFPYDNGVFVINEGPFQSGVGSITYYDFGTKETTQNIFEHENSRPLGNIVQSMSLIGDESYIVVNNANKVEVVSTDDFKSVAAIEGFVMPRYAIKASETKVYISQWGNNGVNGSVIVVDATTHSIIDTILTGSGTSKMLMANNHIFAVNSGGFGTDSTVVVIDPNTDEIVHTIPVGHNPNSILLDDNNKIWVMCGGKKTYDANFNLVVEESTSGSLHRINPQVYGVELSIGLDNINSSPANMCSDGEVLYFTHSFAVYSQSVTSDVFSNTIVINKNFYGLDLDSKSGLLYGADALGFASQGLAISYDVDFVANSAVAVDTFDTGIIPNGFMFYSK